MKKLFILLICLFAMGATYTSTLNTPIIAPEGISSSGSITAASGAFTNSLTLNGQAVITNGGPAVVGMVPVATDTTGGSWTPTNNVTLNVNGIINVKSSPYNATGNAQKVTDGVLTNASVWVKSATANFTVSDVGKSIWGIDTSGTVKLAISTITNVVDSTRVQVSNAASGSVTGISIIWGTDDSDALIAAKTAAEATVPPSTIYVPAGGYIFRKCPFKWAANATPGPNLIGAGMNTTVFYPRSDFDYTTTSAGSGIFVAGNGPAGISMRDFSIDGSLATFTAGYRVIYCNGSAWTLNNITIKNFLGLSDGIYYGGGSLNQNVSVSGLTTGMYVAAGGNVFLNCYTGNGNGTGTGNALRIVNLKGTNDLGAYFRWFGGIVDETTSTSISVETASSDISFIGAKLWSGGNQYVMGVDSGSVVNLVSCEAAPYNGGGNRFGLYTYAGGIINANMCRIGGRGTGWSLNNNGTFNDLGGNTFVGNYTNTGTINGPNTIGPYLNNGLSSITTTWTNMISGVITQRISTVGGVIVTNLTL